MEVLVAGDARVVRVRASRRRARLAIVILANRPRLAAAAAGQEEDQHQLRRHDDCPPHQRCQGPPACAQERGGVCALPIQRAWEASKIMPQAACSFASGSFG